LGTAPPQIVGYLWMSQDFENVLNHEARSVGV